MSFKTEEKPFRSDRYEREHTVRRKQTEWYKFVTENKMIEFGSMTKDDKDKTEKVVNPDFSHTLLAGGVLNVPIERYLDLLRALSIDLNNNFVPDFNEVSPPITRLYMDLDFKDQLQEGGVKLYKERKMVEYNNGNGTEKFPAIFVEEDGLERHRLYNVSVAKCIAEKVAEYFPTVDKSDPFFIVHCLWRSSRFKTQELNYVNANGKHVRELVISERSFGLHLVWPNLHVTHAQALDIREGVIRALASRFYGSESCNNRSKPGTNSWQEVVDEKVYLPLQSLRMVLSDKYETCKECEERNKRLYGTKIVPKKRKVDESEVVVENPLEDYRSHCHCHGSGKIPVNSIYRYEATVNPIGQELTGNMEGGFLKEFKSVFQMLVQCCIRNPRRPDLIRNNAFAPDDPVMVLPKDAPRYKGFKPSIKKTLTENTKELEKYNTTACVPSRSYISTKDTVEFSVDSAEFMAVQNLFLLADSVVTQAKHNNAPILDLTVYKNIVVYRLRRCCISDNYFYLVDVTDCGESNDSKFCFNINRIHTCEKNVFFKITQKSGIVQKCNCFSPNRTISCQNFQSAPCALPKDCLEVLFPKSLLDAKNASIVATSLRRSKSLLEMSRDKIDAEIEKPFVTMALGKTEAETLKRFASQTPIVDEQTGIVSSSQSPSEIMDELKEQKYEKLLKTDTVVQLEEVEEVEIAEVTEKVEVSSDVKTLVDKLKKVECKSSHGDRTIKNKLIAAFEETYSLAYRVEK